MPQTPTANMSLIKPTEDGDSGVWDVLLDALIDLIDAHDHTTGKGVKVPSAALEINADVAWNFGGTYYAITGALALDLQPTTTASVSTYSSALFANSADSNNLYYRNSSGTNVKITDGATLDVSIVGGIGGDYSSVEALFDYDDATDTYRFRQETSAAVRQYAKLASADVQLFEYIAAGGATVPTNAVTLKSPGSLAASYSVTWPAAVPGAQALLQMSTAGVLSASNTIAQSLTATDFRHTTSQTLVLQGALWCSVNDQTEHQIGQSGSGAVIGWKMSTAALSTTPMTMPIPLKAGDVITGYSVYVNKGQTAGAITAKIWMHRDSAVGTETAQSAGSSIAAGTTGFLALSESGLAITLAAGFQYYLVFVPQNSVTPSHDHIFAAEVSFTRP